MNLWWRLLWLRLRLRAHRSEPLSLWDEAVTPFRVVPTDLDVLGHMNNGRYLTLMDLGRLDLMVRSGFWADLQRRAWFPVVAGQTITFRKELRLGTRFDLHTRVIGLDERWGYLEQRFMVGDTVHAHALVRTRFLRRSGGTVDHDDLEAAIGGLPPHLRVDDWMREWTAHTRVPSSQA
ncbi:thioesterase family protein [Demequina sp. NBRC 110051]|uniref:acyl-CoA thioesterase n=1 Tax=Demequina sp. NBRC 110051 TaxID=1570340 RepID=UPI000A059FB7|nr:acyl-CoA thioesterase [Demequina sp. NBRC 110051]